MDAVTALAHRVSPDGPADTAVHEPKNIVSNIEYTIDLPILKDADPEVEDFLEQVESQFCNANNGKGVNAREKIIFVRNALEKAGLKIEDMDVIEANEAFASQALAVARDLNLDMSKVNLNGGAIALGHPIGASGARILTTLLYELKKQPNAKLGLATLCVGGGMGHALIVEKM